MEYQRLVLKQEVAICLGGILWLDGCLGFEPRLAQSRAENMSTVERHIGEFGSAGRAPP